MSFIDFNWWPIFIPFFIGLFKIKYFEKPLKIFFFFVSYGVVNECTVFALRHTIDVKNTMPATNFYLIVTFIIIGIFYSQVLAKIINRKLVVWFVSVLAFYFLFHILFFHQVLKYPTVLRSVAVLIYIIFSIIYFYNVMVETKIRNLWNEPLIWINLGVLIYYSSNLFYSILFNIILEYSREFSKLTIIYFIIFNTLYYVLIAIGFWKTKKSKPVLI